MPLDSVNRPRATSGRVGGATAAAADKIDVTVAHADAIVHAGLTSLLGGCDELRVNRCLAPPAPGGRAAVLIVDYHGGLEHLRRGAEDAAAGRQRVLIVTAPGREWEVRAALIAGVHGHLRQNADPAQLLTAVRALSRGERYPGGAPCDALGGVGLTGRENDVLQQLALGHCNKLIARKLGIGVGTIKSHVKGLCDKLGASTRTEVVVLAIRRGLVGAEALAPISPDHKPQQPP